MPRCDLYLPVCWQTELMLEYYFNHDVCYCKTDLSYEACLNLFLSSTHLNGTTQK